MRKRKDIKTRVMRRNEAYSEDGDRIHLHEKRGDEEPVGEK
jgi:hypothetical protein